MAYKQRRPLNVTDGGTGNTSFASGYAPIVSGVSPTAAFAQADTDMGNLGYVLTSNGSLSIPSWQAIPASGIEDILGDTGGPQSGPTVTISGGSTGLSFGGAINTLTTSFAGITANGGTVNLATDSTTSSINIATGAGVKTTTIGSTNSTSATTIVGGTGGINLSGTSVNLPTTNASTGAGVVNVNSNIFMHSAGTSGTYLGSLAGNLSTTSTNTVAIGTNTCRNITTGVNNVAVGVLALTNITTGSNNIGIGSAGGQNLTLGDSNNIIINNTGQPAGTNNRLVIGQGTGTGDRQLNQSFIYGINGISVTGSAVLVSSSNQLGVTVSSRRYKENIEDMGDASSPILSLRPVKFNYNFGEDRSQQTGLIAEEVEEIMPSLVVYNGEGLPDSVKYHELPALLLNELQKAVKRIESLEAKIALLES